MKTDVLIIGGGLSGLFATWQLRSAGVNASLLEARARFGGRVLTIGDADCDLGPSWIWPGQPLVISLLEHFKIPCYEQFAEGAILFQQMDGIIERIVHTSPMAGALRVQGGINRLTDKIANEIDESHRLLSQVVTGLSISGDGVIVDVTGPTGPTRVEAQQVVLAIPPRLAAELNFNPGLPDASIQMLAETPTWMAGHAKFFAVYEKPFWRQQGLSGSVISQRGPLAEIHDASPEHGRGSSLFGFSGLDATRRASHGKAELIRQAVAHLVELFGESASRPEAVHLQDWSNEKFTAGAADRSPQNHHPRYGLKLDLGDDWQGRLDFISTETSFSNGGLIEGALEAGIRFCRSYTGRKLPLGDDACAPHTANMSWDWL